MGLAHRMCSSSTSECWIGIRVQQHLCRSAKLASMADSDSLAEYLAVAIEAAKRAGEIIRVGFYQTKHVEHRGQVDLVTETDKACEDLILTQLKQRYPDHKFIGEETSGVFRTADLADEPMWMVDPLDGTTNFVHGFPFVCVSIGLAIKKIPTVGVVYNPILDEHHLNLNW